MAKDKKPRTTSCFLISCFGIPEDGERPSAGTKSNSSNKINKKSRWLSISRVWVKKSGAKTVPVNTSTTISIAVDVESEKAEAKRRYDESTLKSKSNKVRRSRSSEKLSGSKRRDSEVAAATTTTDFDQDKPREIRSDATTNGQNPVPEPAHPEPDRNDTCQLGSELSFRRKIDSIRAGSSQPGSPARRTRPGQMPLSASFAAPGAPPRKKLQQRRTGASSRNLDPVVGMSVIMVTLIIMVLWGRLCAILCTAAWLYIIPRARSMGRSGVGGECSDPDGGRNGLDYGSEEYKKKVVLEGFLERNRRSSLREKELVKGSI